MDRKKFYRKKIRPILAKWSPKSPSYVFHHIPKCGGMSLRDVLKEWFILRTDYREGWTTNYPPKQDVSRFRSAECLSGHFELDGYHLNERYPEVFDPARFRIFSFIREPLELRMSYYSYLGKKGQERADSLEAHLEEECNYIASVLGVGQEDFKPYLDQYYFIGLQSHFQEGLNRLAGRIGKPVIELPRKNRSQPQSSSPARVQLSDAVISKFRQMNTLDYAIYDYCQERYFQNGGFARTAEV
ncbi:hypothetical protein [Coraliomargarita parva]|uniref:hypothetical protein n=1 Tax=Coraliomargarita parva TaxID=3014050 RepID=UPI0022B40B43|nr:hypothetical protein [Coraliomargarita parva]